MKTTVQIGDDPPSPVMIRDHPPPPVVMRKKDKTIRRHHSFITSMPNLTVTESPRISMDISSAVNINLRFDPNDFGSELSRKSDLLPTIPEPSSKLHRSTVDVHQPPPLKPKPSFSKPFRDSFLSRMDSEGGDSDFSSPTWSVDEEMSTSTGGSGGMEVDSGCSPDMDHDNLSCDRVAAIHDEEMAVLVQISCDHTETMEQQKYINFIAAVTRAAFNYFRRQNSAQSTLNTTQIEQLVLSSTRPVKEHVQNLSAEFSDHIVIQKATCRTSSKKGYVGVFVKDTVTTISNCSIGKSGVILVFKKINRFAPTEEFANQLSQHILQRRPESLGTKLGFWATIGRKAKVSSPKHLLTQTFTFDNSITVSEAARRSLLEVTDFVLYG